MRWVVTLLRARTASVTSFSPVGPIVIATRLFLALSGPARIKFSPVRNLVEANAYSASLEASLTICEVIFPGSFETLIEAERIRLLARISEIAAASVRAFARSFRRSARERQAEVPLEQFRAR